MAAASAAAACGGDTRLVDRCIDAAARGAATVEAWRRQRRSLERLPAQLADALLHRLAARGFLFPSLLEVFQHSVEDINLSGYTAVDAEWLSYLGSFRYLRVLKLADCKNVSNSAVWALSGMSTLKELDLSRCSKISDAGIRHIVSIENLEKLHLSETGLTDNGVLTRLEHLDIWGSETTNEGASVLKAYTRLSFLNVSWTNVTRVSVMVIKALRRPKAPRDRSTPRRRLGRLRRRHTSRRKVEENDERALLAELEEETEKKKEKEEKKVGPAQPSPTCQPTAQQANTSLPIRRLALAAAPYLSSPTSLSPYLCSQIRWR